MSLPPIALLSLSLFLLSLPLPSIMDSSSSVVPTLRRIILTDTNFTQWEEEVKDQIDFAELSAWIDGSYTCPKSGIPQANAEGVAIDSAVAIRGWVTKDRKARAIISMGLSHADKLLIKDKSTSKDAWDAIRAHHKEKGGAGFVATLSAMANRKYVPGTSMTAHLTAYADDLSLLSNSGVEVPQAVIAGLCLASLDNSWSPTVQTVSARTKAKDLTLAEISVDLEREARRRISQGLPLTAPVERPNCTGRLHSSNEEGCRSERQASSWSLCLLPEN